MKPWYHSKTIWFNILAGLASIAAPLLEPVRPYLSAQTYMLFMSVIAIANVFLRVITTQGLKTNKE